ncbi:MAG: 3-isopropylmalate dehydratase [Campylobacteraceae bacterium]
MQNILNGKVFLFGNNVDTDQIYPGRFVEFTDVSDVAKYAMFGADENFTKKIKSGDFIVGGTNFGCGSSREHAAITLKAVGVGAVIAESFARIFYRNGINLGLPLLVVPNITKLVKAGESIKVNIQTCEITKDDKVIAKIEPISEYMLNILKNGGIKPLIKKELEKI